jgi:hypothetical protein
MGHDYGVPLRFLSVTPTRDNDAAPGNRLADKHSRLFHGKTLDEWTMIQLWSSKYLGKAIFVCETEMHKMKLQPIAIRYGVELIVRPREMLHPINDTGGLPIYYGIIHALKTDYYSLISPAFVVSPCRKPGFFDNMVENYLELVASNPDFERGQALVVAASEIDGAMFEQDESGVWQQLGSVYLNRNPKTRLSIMNHWMGATWWYIASLPVTVSRHDLSLHPKLYDVEPWEDIHIDTEDQWDAAEYWFGVKILNKLGKDCYERYRASWKNT